MSTTSNSSPHNPFSTLPRELFYDIVALATNPAGKFELALDPDFHVRADGRQMPLSQTIRIEGEYPRVISTHLAILLTCKEWYANTIHNLWSHLSFPSSSLKETVVAAYNAVKRNPLLASSIRRMTILASTMRNCVNESLWKDYAAIIRLLPNLEVLVCPHRLTINLTIPSDRLQVVHLLPSWTLGTAYTTSLFETGWKHVRVLTICPNRAVAAGAQEGTTMFPNLTHLQLDVTASKNILHISKKWKAPKLQVLALQSLSFTQWLPFMRQHGPQLRRLEVCGSEDADTTDTAHWSDVRFAKLASLFTTPGTVALDDFNAPNMTSFGIFNIPSAENDGLETSIAQVDAALERWPRLKAVHLIGDDGKPVISGANRVTNRHVQRWMSRGVLLQD